MKRSEILVFCLVTILCSLSSSDSDNSTVSTHRILETTSSTPLKCSRDYHCSSCDVCLSGICTHQSNLNCSRDYHCTSPCDVCRSGKCIPGDKSKKCETVKDCDAGGWCLDSKCVENKCEKDSDCGMEKAVCKQGFCKLA